MTKPVLLNNIDHKDLRVATGHGARYGDDVMSALTFPGEFRQLQACYPIVFAKTGDGAGFQSLALFGFQEGENLFLEGERWDAPYVPLAIERQPFLIGRGGGELTIHVDMDHPRIDPAGEPVFLPHGGTTPYIERINSTLQALHEGLESAPGFIEALLQNELLESFVLDIELDDGSQNRLAGFYTINEDRLAALAPEAAGRLHRAGHLEPVYMALASLAQFRSLIDRKNRRNAGHR